MVCFVNETNLKMGYSKDGFPVVLLISKLDIPFKIYRGGVVE